MVLEYIGMCSGVVMLLSIPLNWYVMFKKLDAAEHYMQQSTYITQIRNFFRNTPFEGRHQRLYAMATVILIPNILHRRNFVRVEDVKKIPRRLRYWMVIPTLVTYLSFITMIISGYYLYY